MHLSFNCLYDTFSSDAGSEKYLLSAVLLASCLGNISTLDCSLNRHTMTVYWINNSTRCQLRLQERHGMFFGDEVFVHGLIYGDLIACEWVFISSDSFFSREKFLMKLWATRPALNSIIHSETFISWWIHNESCGSLSFKQGNTCVLSEEFPVHCLVDANFLFVGSR